MGGLFGEPDLTPARYLSWAIRNPAHVRILQFPVALRKMPPGVESMLLYDICLIRRGSDEDLCRTHPVLWRRVARGNVLLRIRYSDATKDEVRFILQGLRKFAAYEPLGGDFDAVIPANGADDDDQEYGDPSRNFKCCVCEGKVKPKAANWPSFFVCGAKALELTECFAATEKENGEAAHFSVIKVNGDILYLIGSKNVHMIVRDADDISRYKGGAERLLPNDYVNCSLTTSTDCHDRFIYAKRIASTLMHLLFEDDRRCLIDAMLQEALTANFELIDPGSRHFVYYDEILRPELRFIAWTSANLDPAVDGLTRPYLPSLELAQQCGLKTVQHTCYSRDDLQKMIDENRPRINSEGLVVYCCDDQGRTLGLWKMKTVWYTMHKCICNVLLRPKTSALDAKIQEFGRKLCLTNAEIERWRVIGRNFYLWLEKRSLLDIDNLRSKYSTLFVEYEHSQAGI